VTVTTTASPGARNDAALHAIRDHHEVLSRQLADHVDKVLTAVRARADHPVEPLLDGTTSQARDSLVAFLADDLLPHASAEEHTLYPAAAADTRTGSLVSAMLDEHVALAERAASLKNVTDPVSLVAVAAELRAIFAVHVGKENDQLLPALVDQGADLDGLLSDTHHLISHPDPAAIPQLDVRHEAPARRHDLIFSTYGALAPGESFVLVTDHDPKPLYYQFAAEHAGQFVWEYQEQGPEVWRVRIGRVATTP
jgi:uncharacterized protein (DUF2249 family)